MKNGKLWLRGVITLGIVGTVAASLIVSPAAAHLGSWPHLKSHIKKIATKIAKKQATTVVTDVGGTLFIEETELNRFGPISLNDGSADATIGTFGPFTLKAHCDEAGGTLTGELLIATSADHSAYAGDNNSNSDFAPGDGDEIWLTTTDTFPSTSQEFLATDHYDLEAASATGTTTLNVSAWILLNGEASGAPDCLFGGAALS